MAKYIGLALDAPEEDSERRVADSLKRLPDDWTVLHHVSWQSKRGGRQGDGEADFLVLHPQKGMLVIEVKGGGINVEAGRWYTTNRHGHRAQIKNPYEQAVASKHGLLGWLKDRGFEQKIRIGHAVIFPHMSSIPQVGPAASLDISFVSGHLENMLPAIVRCFNYWQLNASLSKEDVREITDALAPTVSVSPGASINSSSLDEKILSLTNEQIETFAGLRAIRGGLVLGSAGTGKTLLAIARAKQLAKDGFRTLLVCYNELLGKELHQQASAVSGVTACTFHALCLREAAKAKKDIPLDLTTDWWEKGAPELLVDACGANESVYDAIVIDEGQDFSPAWIESLQCLLSTQKDAPFFIFADPLQDIWGRSWDKTPGQDFIWELKRNMRNTAQIASHVAAVLHIDCKNSGIEGPVPVWHVTKKAPSEADVIEVVEGLLDEKFSPEKVIVLCDSPALVSLLRGRIVGPFSLGKWGGNGIAVETINRFKGLDAQAVVLVFSHAQGAATLTSAYVGISRARVLLAVIGRNEDKKHLNWLRV